MTLSLHSVASILRFVSRFEVRDDDRVDGSRCPVYGMLTASAVHSVMHPGTNGTAHSGRGLALLSVSLAVSQLFPPLFFPPHLLAPVFSFLVGIDFRSCCGRWRSTWSASTPVGVIAHVFVRAIGVLFVFFVTIMFGLLSFGRGFCFSDEIVDFSLSMSTSSSCH